MKKSSLNIPNILTVFRIIITGVILYFMCVPVLGVRLAAAGLFVVAVLTDFLDGVIARKYDLVTTFGKIADPIADKFLLIGMYSVFSLQLGLFSFWWIVPVIIREVVITVLRLSFLFRNEVVAAESAGKLKVGFQVSSLVAALAVLFLRDHFGNVAVYEYYYLFVAFMYVTLILAVLLTIYSGLIFLIKKWLTQQQP